QDAIDAGVLDQKKRSPAEDKMRTPAEDKSVEQEDDLTEIPGVGPSTAEDLRAQGLATLEELHEADLSALDGRARRAIERWRESSEET
ncbi:MAG: helix-hairpin-helix domain-containing protein, partial [Anaerolineae bacterium]